MATFAPPSHKPAPKKPRTPASQNFHVPAPTRRPPAKPITVQPKLLIGAVNDPLEREADRIADQVLAGAPTGTSPLPATSLLSTAQKIALIRQMLDGWTGNADERAIIVIIEHSTAEELGRIFADDNGALDPKQLLRRIHWQRRRLAAVLRAKLGVDLYTFSTRSKS